MSFLFPEASRYLLPHLQTFSLSRPCRSCAVASFSELRPWKSLVGSRALSGSLHFLHSGRDQGPEWDFRHFRSQRLFFFWIVDSEGLHRLCLQPCCPAPSPRPVTVELSNRLVIPQFMCVFLVLSGDGYFQMQEVSLFHDEILDCLWE